MRYLDRLSQFLVYLGIPGIFLLALLDSAGIPMMGGPDAVILLLAWHNPAHALPVALSAALGSLLGCLILYRIGRTGGNFAMARITAERRDKIRCTIERHAGWACFLAVMSPPPLPTKPILLAAGALKAPTGTFSVAVLAGRLLRYSLLAWLGARFGSDAARIVREHYLLGVAVLLGASVAFLLLKSLRQRRIRPAAASAGISRSTDLP